MTKFELQPCQLAWKELPDLEDYQQLSSRLCNMQRSIPWWIGDMVVGGEAQFGDEIYQSIDDTFSLDLINRYAKVSRAFKRSERFPTLSWTHHQLVATMNPHLRDALLARAESERWDTQQFRQFVKGLE